MTLEALNHLPPSAAKEAFLKCCGADRWADAMVNSRPFADQRMLYETADRIWHGLAAEDWREAFDHHPRIGDLDSLKAKYADTRQWAEGEQAGAAQASDAVLTALAEGNRKYETYFGHLFIVCATGKTAEEMLDLLHARLPNHPDRELRIAAEEQRKITRIRLEKLIHA
jgi:2-oxo-4-hydroxy-4-carboxy-5-ureidoimidazoline decarboxylase